jgi:hypothetical protein
LPAVLRATLAVAAGFRTALVDFFGEAGLFKRCLLVFRGEQNEEST